MSKGIATPTMPHRPSGSSNRDTTGFVSRRWLNLAGNILTGFWIVTAGTMTGQDLGLAQLFERQTQSVFFDLRGVVSPPPSIVILEIDEKSMNQQQFFLDNPTQRAYLEPIQSWPWKRVAYATVIDRLLSAGARAVSLDIVFDSPSQYGAADDQAFVAALQRHRDRTVLGAQYSLSDSSETGFTDQLISPIPQLQVQNQLTGSINYLIEANGKMHRLGNQVLVEHQRYLSPQQAEEFRKRIPIIPSFAEATLDAAHIQYPAPAGTNIFFYGPGYVFPHVSFVDVLDPDTWDKQFQSGEFFRDKIVIIGSTAKILQDFHAAPFDRQGAPLAGIEIHANAIATLLEGRSIRDMIPQAPLRGVFVLLLVGLAGWYTSRPQQPLRRWFWGMGLAIAWVILGYVSFVYGRVILPVAIPAGAIALSGFSQLLTGTAKEQMRKKQLREALRQYVTSPIVQEIISQQDDLQDLLRDRELALAGKLLSSRYRIIRVLGSGGFSETYVSEDTQRPGNPLCVVKQLRVTSNNPNTLKMARRLFATEAETLEKLGQHEHIPHLLACFEENEEFYLVQEFIPGHPLHQELLPHRHLPETDVLKLLNELLLILDFVHSQGVIHRDLKPSNIIRRKSDQRLVLIDFGIAKKITTQLANVEQDAKFTVAVGTPGYMPSEQAAGRPFFNSDIYALGMIGIEALTGGSPHLLKQDAQTGKILWRDQATQVSSELADILDKMVQQDFTQRYFSAKEVLDDLKELPSFISAPWVRMGTLNATDLNQTSVIEQLHTEADDWDADTQVVEGLDADTQTVALPDDWNNG